METIEIHNNITKKYPKCKFFIFADPDRYRDRDGSYILRIEEAGYGQNITLTKEQAYVLLNYEVLPESISDTFGESQLLLE